MYNFYKFVHTFNGVNKMNRRLKKSVVYFLYGVAFIFMLVGLLFIDKSQDNISSSGNDYKYVSKDIIEGVDDIPVNVIDNSKIIIGKPYNDEDIKIVRDYYNISDSEETQKNSIIFYQDTYIPSSGVSYGLDNVFDVVAILDGKVTEVKEDDILGNVITIEHDNGIISIYQSIKDFKVKSGDVVKQGDIIASSSSSNISADLGNHLYFELVINGINVDPEDYYGKCIDEI